MKLLVPSLVALTLAGAAGDKTFEADNNHTVLGFKASTLLFDVPGRFDKYAVTAAGNPDKPDSASVKLEIDAASINTGNEKRDEHLRSEDFFDVKKHPKIVFTSKSVKREGNKITVVGTLDMHGQKQDVTIPFETVTAKNGAGYDETVYKGTTVVKNSAFGIGAQSIAAKISLKDETELNLLLAGFWNDVKAAGKK